MTTPDAVARLEKLAAHYDELGELSLPRGFSQAAADLRFAIAAIAERERLEDTLRWFRQRAYGLARVTGTSHSTACLIWGDDGQGGTAEGFPEPLPCTCGALINFASQDARAALQPAGAGEVA